MDQVVIKRNDGSALSLFTWNKVSGIKSAEQKMDLSGEDVVNISLVSAEIINFELGFTLDVFGRLYKLNILPNIVKVNDRRFEYEVQLEGVQYDLMKVQYMDIDQVGFSTGAAFSLMGNLEVFLKLIIQNLQRVYGFAKWTIGDYPADTDYQNMDFQNENCLQVVQKVCEAYEQNFDFERLPGDNFKLHIRKPDRVLQDIFRYGRARGLYSLQRMRANDKNIVTRLFAYGAVKNLPLNYRAGSQRLKMPLSDIFSEGQPYIEDLQAIAKYGVIEGAVMYDDIYPNRTGTVTQINATNPLQFFDTSMDFNLSESINGDTTYLIDGVSPKIIFKTGNLAGYEFNLNGDIGYIHSLRQFTINSFTDELGNVLPSSTEPAFQIQPGDKYTIVDIAMPQSYISAAEEALVQRAGQFLYDNSKPRVTYGLTIDAMYLWAKPHAASTIINYFNVGDYLRVLDADLGIDGTAQIQSLKRNILQHYEYDITLGDEEVNNARRVFRSKRRKIMDAARNTGTLINPSTANQIAQIATAISTQAISQAPIGGIFSQEW